MTTANDTNITSSIDSPRLWRLALLLDGDSLRAVVWSTVREASMLQFSVPLNPTLPRLKALEDAIYATPVLLSDYLSVDIVVATKAYTILPPGSERELVRDVADYCALTDDDTHTVNTDTIAGVATVAWTLDSDIDRFLRRTFRNPVIQCHISPLIKFFGLNKNRGNGAKVFVHLAGSAAAPEVDIIAFGHDGRLAIVATHDASSDNDVIYNILASAQLIGIDTGGGDEILMCGTAALRSRIMPQVRKYAAGVLPLIFPSAAFRNGREALSAPFPLVILPLCE